jgi:hypothetical protein
MTGSFSRGDESLIKQLAKALTVTKDAALPDDRAFCVLRARFYK